ncbi:ATP-binding protein [Thalassotalea sp. 1_MG-2023]|uniref:ATP-binding protein n=1 Tax=Thalassotalea sp. 1_MG-2023 TaxID=3062680 RepID=UPI0026E1958C|nr:ATP-binding protein [Thalassotalea sp. 1_MG-2023]MDO6427148.1 ATP-binding protein [Thalassotalea sp. 1_MG-2023]
MNLKKQGNNQVVTRYKLSIIGIFFAILLVAVSMAGYRYYHELESHELNEYGALENQSYTLNETLKQAINSISSIQRFANYALSKPDHFPLATPLLEQEGERFYLAQTKRDIIEQRQQLSVNITGIGQVTEFNDELKHELAMAYTLTPAFVNAQSTNHAANWFYYVSKNQFVSIYPWISRENWQYSASLLDNDQIKQLSNTAYFSNSYRWSAPYLGSSATSLYSSVGAGVFDKETFVGAVVINIDLARLHNAIIMNDDDNHRYILFNQHDQVLLHKTANNLAINQVSKWQSFMPDTLKDLTYETLQNEPASFQHNGWLVQQFLLPSTDWVLLRYQPYKHFSQPVVNRFIWSFLLLFIGQTALLSVVYFVTRKTFIKPTQAFISHIAFSAQGDHGKITPPSGWQHWFNIVGDIFSQNRSLLQQLKDQNNVLDMRVHEKTQALLEKSQQHQRDYAILRSVMNAIPDYLIFNDSSGQVIGCNLAFERFVSSSEMQIIGQQAGKLINNELGKALLACETGGKTTESMHGIFRVIETVSNTYELFSSNFYDQDNQVLGTIIIIRDVTEQYAVNAALENAKEQAELANKAKSQFLANMSHEIRTPINAIQGMHALLTNTQLTLQQTQQIANAQDASDTLLHLVDELLDLAKIESGNMNIVKDFCSVDHIVHRAINLNKNLIVRKKLTLQVVIEPDVPEMVFTDDMRLVQVLSNLLNNAVKFTEQGSININVGVIANSSNKTLVKFSVKDTGIGIALDKQKTLFDAFIQADESMTRKYGGSGLGLSICQRIVNLLDGEIKIKSAPMQGSEFSFILPFNQSNNAQQQTIYTPVTIESFGVTLPDSFVQLLSSLHYRYQQLSDFEQHQVTEDDTCFLFVRLDVITTENCKKIVEYFYHATAKTAGGFVLAVYQQDNTLPTNNAYQLLDQAQIPYVICDAPLYRYTLCQLHLALKSVQQNKPLTPINKQKINNKQQVKQKKLSGVTVLLVEDNLVNQLVAKELLLSMGASVIVAENGEVALSQLDKSAVDIVLMDIQMPVMDGLTATKIIRENSKFTHLPIIAMTAHARQEDKNNSIAAGMNMHVAKPVKAEVLLKNILAVLN